MGRLSSLEPQPWTSTDYIEPTMLALADSGQAAFRKLSTKADVFTGIEPQISFLAD